MLPMQVDLHQENVSPKELCSGEGFDLLFTAALGRLEAGWGTAPSAYVRKDHPLQPQGQEERGGLPSTQQTNQI